LKDREKQLANAKGNSGSLFYGYWIVFATFIFMATSFGLLFSFGVFFKPLISEFGWPRSVTSGAYSALTFISGLMGILAGRISDKLGSKTIAVTTGLFLGFGFLLLSKINTIWQFYLIYSLILAAGVGAVWPGLAPSVARWFIAKRGLMTGIASSGSGFGTFIFPPLAALIISIYDWRRAYMTIGAATLIFLVLIALLFKRDPAQIGQLPYGQKTNINGTLSKEAEGLCFKEAILTKPFLLLCTIYFFYGYVIHTVMVHIVPHATDMGISSETAPHILSVIGATSIASRVFMANVSDRIGAKPSITIVLSVLTVSLVFIQWARNTCLLYLFAFFFGLPHGGALPLLALAVVDLFGLPAIGVILGVVVFSYTVGASMGPLFSGYIFDVMESYNFAFWGAAGFAAISLILVCCLNVPFKKKNQRSPFFLK
jgi:MFS family permease